MSASSCAILLQKLDDALRENRELKRQKKALEAVNNETDALIDKVMDSESDEMEALHKENVLHYKAATENGVVIQSLELDLLLLRERLSRRELRHDVSMETTRIPPSHPDKSGTISDTRSISAEQRSAAARTNHANASDRVVNNRSALPEELEQSSKSFAEPQGENDGKTLAYHVTRSQQMGENWLKKAVLHVDNDFIELGGGEYASMLLKWGLLEEHYSYRSPTRGFLTKNRPADLAAWINDRRQSYKPRLVDAKEISVFCDNVQKWWLTLKPMEGKEDDWRRLDKCGQNGWLGLIVCMRWWGDAILAEQHDSEAKWADTVKDMSQTLSDLLDYKLR